MRYKGEKSARVELCSCEEQQVSVSLDNNFWAGELRTSSKLHDADTGHGHAGIFQFMESV